MCGLLGVINLAKPTNTYVQGGMKTEKFLLDGVVVGTLRGKDSTGLMAVDLVDNSYFVHKSVIPGPDFANHKAVQGICSVWYGYNLVAIHHRAATIGGVSYNTAHPHTEGDITLMHNGTISNYRSSKYQKGNMNDSQTIAAAINAEGPSAIKNIDGPMALVWFDGKTQTIHLYRNSERPLAIAPHEGKIYFASEMGMLKWLLARNEIYPKEFGEVKANVHLWTGVEFKLQSEVLEYTKPAYVYHTSSTNTPSWSNPNRLGLSEMVNCYLTKSDGHICKSAKAVSTHNVVKGQEIEFYGAYMRASMQGKVLAGYGAGSSSNPGALILGKLDKNSGEFKDGRHPWVGKIQCVYVHPQTKQIMLVLINVRRKNAENVIQLPSSMHTNTPTTTTTPEVSNDSDSSEDQPVHNATVRGPKGSWITVDKFTELTKHGCGYCQRYIPITESDEIVWVGDCPVCDSCVGAVYGEVGANDE